MPTFPITTTDVGELVARENAFYQPEGARIPGDSRYSSRPTRATPSNMMMLVEQLDQYTRQVQEAAESEGMVSDSNVPQWSNDMSNWVMRLNAYRRHLETIPNEANADTIEGADAIYWSVTAPLLDGVWYERLPGIVLTAEEVTRMRQGPPGGFSNYKPPDVHVPFSLGNQVIVYRDHQRERWEQFWEDLKSNARDLLVPDDDFWETLKTLGVIAGGALVGGTATYLLVRNVGRGQAAPPASPVLPPQT